jgi:hypothetical protein
MNRIVTLGLATLTACAVASAQENPLSAAARQAYNAIKNNMSRMADKMPEEHYSFKPVPEIRTFGQLVAHVADAQAGTCSSAMGERKSIGAAQKTTKADLVAALKESFAICDAAFDSLTDAKAMEMVAGRGGQRPRIAVLQQVTTHTNEEYGYMAVYLRLKGIVPPSSEGR